MRTRLAVQVTDNVGTRDVTRFAKGLHFKRTAYGGDAEMGVSLNVPLYTFEGLGPNDKVEIFDGRSGESIFLANTDNPGAIKGPRGNSYDLTAFGYAARLQYVTKSLAYVETSLDSFKRGGLSSAGAQDRNDERGGAGGTQTIRVFANEGKSVTTAWQHEFLCRRFAQENLTIARCSVGWEAGLTDANYVVQIRGGTDPTTAMPVVSASPTASTAGTTLEAYYGTGGSMAGTETFVALRVNRNTSTRTATDNDWVQYWTPVLMQLRRNADGSNQAGTAYQRNYVLAHEVIADMLGRGMAPGINATNVTLPTTTYQITALAFWDGITMADLLQQLTVFEPDLYWMAEGSTFTAGLWDDNNPRYVVSEKDGGIDSPGEEVTLCNRVSVSWTDNRGKDRTTVVTATVDGLTYTRDAEPITLPEGMGSAANAQRAGDMALAVTNKRPRAGTAVIRKPIRDQLTGYDVMPWEIEPGSTVLERESGEVLRLTEVEYSDDEGAATLSLNRPVRTIEQRLAQLARRNRRRR